MKTVIIGIGNPLKRDDNIGNLIVDKLNKTIEDTNIIFIKVYLTPENYLIPLRKSNPKKIYIIDAVEFDGSIGEVKLFNLDEIIPSNLTTHNIPITFYKDYFPHAKIRLIGIKVKDVDFGEDMSKDIQNKFDNILEEVKRIIS